MCPARSPRRDTSLTRAEREPRAESETRDAARLATRPGLGTRERDDPARGGGERPGSLARRETAITDTERCAYNGQDSCIC